MEVAEEEGKKERLRNAMMFVLTDNSTVEVEVMRGNTSSKGIFEKVVVIKR